MWGGGWGSTYTTNQSSQQLLTNQTNMLKAKGYDSNLSEEENYANYLIALQEMVEKGLINWDKETNIISIKNN